MKAPKLLAMLLRNLFKKPSTVEYWWRVELNPPSSYRGVHYVDTSKCIGCGLCSIECPSGAISMVSRGSRRIPVIDYSLCMFCYHCVFICPRRAYVTTNQPLYPVRRRSELAGLRE